MRWLRGRGWIAGVVSAILTLLAVGAAVVIVAFERLPGLLVVAAAWTAPDLRVSLGDARLLGAGGLDVRHLRVYERATNELVLAAKRLRVTFSPWGLRASQLGEVRLVAPLLVVPETSGTGAAVGPPPWTVDRLIVRGGRVWARRTADRPGVAFRFATDLRELGFTGARGGRPQRLRLREVRAWLAAGPPNVVLHNVLLTLRPAAVLEESHVDEIHLFGLAVRLPGGGWTAPAAGDGSGAQPAWRVDRLVTHGARIDVEPSAEQPGVALAFAVDLHELGIAAPLNERLHVAHLRDVRVRLPDRAPSVVLDAVRAEFRLGDLLTQGRLARFLVERGTMVVDEALRTRLAAGGGGPGAAGGASVGVLEIRQLAMRIAELGSEIPDVTLTFSTTLRDVPLSAEALASSREPQRVELADLQLYSPLDPFRPVVHIGSVFMDFTLADVVRQRIASLLLLSPTIYLGEDLIWYMNMARRDAAAATGPAPPPWTIDRVRAVLGRIVVTFNGTNRLDLPITFESQAGNVALDQLASLHLRTELKVPRQSYTFPGFDLALVDMEGGLRFDYPRGEAKDNVVNVLNVREIRWRDYKLTDGWLAVTFDQGGINGKLGGRAYEGYVDAGLSVPFGAAPPWSGWFAGTKLDLAPIAAVVAKGGIEMSGIIDAQGAVDLRQGTRLERAEGELTMTTPGHLRIPDLEGLLGRLPADTTPLQRDLLKIAVEALADYEYTSGGGRADFADARGVGLLTLHGPRGGRRLELHYYQDQPLLAEVRP